MCRADRLKTYIGLHGAAIQYLVLLIKIISIDHIKCFAYTLKVALARRGIIIQPVGKQRSKP